MTPRTPKWVPFDKAKPVMNGFTGKVNQAMTSPRAVSPYKCNNCWDDMGIVQLCEFHGSAAQMLDLLRELLKDVPPLKWIEHIGNVQKKAKALLATLEASK